MEAIRGLDEGTSAFLSHQDPAQLNSSPLCTEERNGRMDYVQLGGSDIRASRLCVGCMSFGDPASKMHAWTLDP